jgi:pimeloyl-ACP methyl ester carboxylesterase
VSELVVDGIRVHYRAAGSGPPVVLLHGGGSSGAQWRGVVRLLEDRYRMVTVDHYGHGGTEPWPGPPTARSHDAEAVLVRAVMDTLDGPVHLVGHSYGGGVALRLALGAPHTLRSLTVLEPQVVAVLEHAREADLAAHYHRWADSFHAAVAAGRPEQGWSEFMAVNDGPGSWERLPPETRARLLGLTDAIVSGWHACLGNPTTPADAAAIALPTLMMHGALTAPMFRRITELLAAAIPAARLHVIPAAGHMAPLTHPEPVASALAAHFDAH